MNSLYFEDFAVGDIFRTRGRTVTRADIAAFACLTWDTNPMHTDATFAERQRFGKPIAHGLLGISYAMGLASGLGVFEDASVALLAVRDWTFKAPIVADDTISTEIEITATRLTSSGTSGFLGRSFRVHNQNGDLVQSGVIDLLVRTRPAG